MFVYHYIPNVNILLASYSFRFVHTHPFFLVKLIRVMISEMHISVSAAEMLNLKNVWAIVKTIEASNLVIQNQLVKESLIMLAAQECLINFA